MITLEMYYSSQSDWLIPRDKAGLYDGGKRAFKSALRQEASITVEAALAVPLWIAGIVALLFLLVAIRTQVTLQRALYHNLINAAGYAYYLGEMELSSEAASLLQAETVKLAVVAEVGEEFFEETFIENNAQGIWLNILAEREDGMIDAALEYRMRPPYDLLGIGSITLVTRAKCRMWLGEDADGETKTAEMVYITAEGTVYHKDRECSYIKVTYNECTMDEIASKRNPEGKKYYVCEICGDSEARTERVYYMKYGTRYHISLSCPNFHRSVYLVELETARKSYRACSKCGGE